MFGFFAPKKLVSEQEELIKKHLPTLYRRSKQVLIADAYGIIKVMSRDLELDEIYLIPNMVESQAAGAQLYRRVNEVCDRFLGKTLQYLTSIESDELVLAALKKYQSVLEFAPGSAGARDYRRLADAITHLPAIHQASGGLQFFMERLVRQNPGG